MASRPDHRLPRADVALEQAKHARLGDEVAADVGERRALRARQRVGQGGRDPLHEPPVAGVGPAGQAAHAAADEGEGELGGEKLVIGEAATVRVRFAAPRP